MTDEKKSNGPLDPTDEKTALKLAEQEPEAENELDSSKVKFINGGSSAAEVHVDVEGKSHLDGDNGFCGLSKEELMVFAKDPFWVKARWILLILFWVAWFGMLAAAVVIIILAPKCPPRPSLTWWQKSLTYQIYPKSFLDTDANGMGDIKGVENKLDYLKDMNVTAVFMNSIYNEADMKTINPDFGTEDDFTNMKIAMHKRGIRIIMDFIPNHTGRNHTWFQESSKGTDNQYSNYYIWHPGKTVGGSRSPPNNWLSVFGGSAWTFDEDRQEYYLHQMLSDQPDLNVSNPAVQKELDDVLQFWLEKGVDGFRIDALPYLFEVDDLNLDEVRSEADVAQDNYDYLVHNLTTFQPKMYEMISRWRSLLDAYTKEEGRNHPRLLVAEVYDATAEQIENLYNYNGEPGLDMPLNMNLINIDSSCDAQCIHGKVRNWVTVVPPGQTEKDRWSNWQVGNHDNSRVASRVGDVNVNAVNMLFMSLPGTAFVYYGDEIGMHDVDISWEQTQDPLGLKWGSSAYMNYSRDPERTPMQWTGGQNAGFTTGSPWLPLASDYKQRNVKAQSAHGSGITQYEVFKSLANIREKPSLQWGSMEDVVVTKDILSYVRQAQGFPGFLVAINFGTEPSTVDFHTASPKSVPEKGKVVTSTENFESANRAADFKPGTDVALTAVYLRPSEGVIVTFDFMK